MMADINGQEINGNNAGDSNFVMAGLRPGHPRAVGTAPALPAPVAAPGGAPRASSTAATATDQQNLMSASG
jgi:hypothetical protein